MTPERMVRERAVLILDLDGTLVDTSPHHAQAYAEVLGRIGIADFDYSAIAGRRTGDVFRSVLARHGRADEAGLAESLAREKQARAVELIAAHPGMLPGARAFLDRARAAGKRLALATSASAAGAAASLRANGLDGLFDAVTTGDDVAEAKPAPDIYRTTLRVLGCDAARCVVFEDSEAGLRAATAAGLDTIVVVRDGKRPGWVPAGVPASDFLRLAGHL